MHNLVSMLPPLVLPSYPSSSKISPCLWIDFVCTICFVVLIENHGAVCFCDSFSAPFDPPNIENGLHSPPVLFLHHASSSSALFHCHALPFDCCILSWNGDHHWSRHHFCLNFFRANVDNSKVDGGTYHESIGSHGASLGSRMKNAMTLRVKWRRQKSVCCL